MKRKGKLGLILLMSALMACAPLSTYSGSAGSILSNTTLTEGINFTNWFYTDDIGENFAQYNKIVFAENSNRLSRIISNKKVNNMKDAGKDEWMSAELTLTITSAPEGKRFGLAFALDNPSSRICSAYSNFLYFTAEGDEIKLGLSKYDAQGAENSLFISQSAIALLGEEINLTLNVAVDGKLNIIVNGVDVGVGDVTVNADGYVGLGQDAKFNAQISKLEVMAYENVTPLNSDIYETFDGNNYNANLLYSRGVTGYNKPSYAKVENGKFLFLNAGTSATTQFNVEENLGNEKVIKTYYYKQTSYITTRYAYSNVDLSFDLQFVGQSAADTSGFSIILGRDSYGESSSELKLEAEKLAKGIKKDLYEVRFTKTNKSKINYDVDAFIEFYNGEKLLEKVPLSQENNIFGNALYGKTISVWLQMLNGNLTVWLKTQGGNGFSKVYQVNTGDTPNGCVQIRANGSSQKDVFSTLGNMTVDNISVTNFDMDAKKQTVAFRTNIWDVSDFEYEDTWDDNDLLGGK